MALVLVSVLVATLSISAILDYFPGLTARLNLNDIHYFHMKLQYVPDPALIFVYPKNKSLDVLFQGDLYQTRFEAPTIQTIHYSGSYNEAGFRSSSSPPPYKIAVLGDSYMELSEGDQDTFSQRLQSVTGESTQNLGRSWYGPYQYVEVCKRYAIPLKPKVVLSCFFAGNDVQDIDEYERWERGDLLHIR